MDIALRSFAGGEIGPQVSARSDQTKYQTGLAECYNTIVQRFGSVINRPGTEYLAPARGGKLSLLVPFVYDDSTVYMLILSEGILQVYDPNNPFDLPAASAFNIGTSYSKGQYASYGGVIYRSRTAGNIGNTPPNGTYWFPLSDDIFAIEAPWTEDDLQTSQYVQSNDVVTLACYSRRPTDIKRYGAFDWRITDSTERTDWFETNIALADVQTSGGPAGSKTHKYMVTAVDPETGRETLPLGGNYATDIVDISNAVDAVFTTTAAHPYVVGDEVILSIFLHTNENTWPDRLWGRPYVVKAKTATTFTLTGCDTSALPVYPGVLILGLWAFTCIHKKTSSDTPTEANPVVISWTDQQIGNNDIKHYEEFFVYKELNGAFGYIGIAGTSNSFKDINYTPVTSDRPLSFKDPFATTFPRCVNYFGQRKIYGNTPLKIGGVWSSRIDSFNEFSTSTPIRSDDAVNFTIAGRRVNEIRHILDLGALVLMTSQGEWVCDTAALTPTSINLKQEGYAGSSWVPPVIIGNTAIFVERNGNSLRDLRFSYETEGYDGKDLCVYAPHLFEGYEITSMAFAQSPNSIIWCVRSDGILLGLTYVKEHDVWAWHTHETLGKVHHVATLPIDGEDRLFMVVSRIVQGVEKTYLEVMDTRTLTDITDAKFLDSAFTTIAQGGNVEGSGLYGITMAVSGGTADWPADTSYTLTASASAFSIDSVGKVILAGLNLDGPDIGLRITGYTSPTVVTVQADTPIPQACRGFARTDWVLGINTIDGLEHLEGYEVTPFVDGDPHPVVEVTGGSVELDSYYKKVRVGIGYISRVKTLDLEDQNGETLLSQKKRIVSAQAKVRKSRGLHVGGPDGKMKPWKGRSTEAWSSPTSLHDGMIDVAFPGTYTEGSSVVIEQRDPLPMEILAIVPRVEAGGR